MKKFLLISLLVLLSVISTSFVFAQSESVGSTVTGGATAPAGSTGTGSANQPTGSTGTGGATAPVGSTGTGGATAPVGSTGTGGATNPIGSTGTGGGTTNVTYLQNPLSSRFSSIGQIISGFLEILSYLAILLAVLAIIWIGLQFVLAAGNSEKIKELKMQLTWVVVGVAIVIGARIIVSLVVNTLSATGVVSPTVIQSANQALQRTP